MKRRKHLLVASLLALTCTIVGCTTEANPSYASTNLVTITDGGNNYFQNNYAKIFFELEKSGSLNTTTFSYVANQVAEEDIGDFFNKDGADSLKELKRDLILDKLLENANKDDYKIDKVYSEQLFINSLASKGYYIDLNNSKSKEQVYVTSESKAYDILTLKSNATAGEPSYDELLNGPYAKYIEKEILRTVNQELVTAKYICQKYFSALGRAYARNASYVALPSKEYAKTGDFVTAWLKEALEGRSTGNNGEFDLASLAKMYRGTEELSEKEKEFAYDGETSKYVTLKSNLDTDFNKIATYNEGTKSWDMKIDEAIDTSIETKYTNSNKYTLDIGYELATRDIKVQNLYKKDLFSKAKGISDLPTAVTDRLFSSSVENYLKEIEIKVDGQQNPQKVKVLTRQSAESGDPVEQLYFYDNSKETFYIVVVDDYEYTTTALKNQCNADETGKVTQVTKKVAKTALQLYSDSYKKEAITYLLEKAGLKDTIHDDRFYAYMKENYGDIFD